MVRSTNLDDPCDISSALSKLKIELVNRLIVRHLNINLLPNIFYQPKNIIGNNIDTLIITETKIDLSFPNAQFMIEYLLKLVWG